MGISASLFYSSNDNEKQTLHQRITPSYNQHEAQKERWNDLAKHLTTDLRNRSGYLVRTWLQGSDKFGTQIRPVHRDDESDIDLGAYFCWEGEPEEGAYEPEQFKDMVQGSLNAYARDADEVVEVVVPPKSRCSRIRYKDSFHIDVPCYHLDIPRDARMLATEKDGWEHSDPKKIYLWFRDQFDDYTRAKVCRHVQYVKAWAALKFRNGNARPSSILLTVLVTEAVHHLDTDDLASDDDALLAVLEKVLARLDRSKWVVNPINPAEILSDRLSDKEFDDFLYKLRRFCDVAKEALDGDSLLEAADKWSAAFEHLFPLPEEEEITEAAVQLAVRVIMPDIRVSAIARQNQHGIWEDTNRLGPIPKDCDITFEIINPNVLPENATIHWMVRNEGQEAENVNDLGHEAGTGPVAQERSAYKGTHYMDCIVKQHGRIIGVQRVPVNITGILMPRRNPARRPNYVKLRGQR